MAHAPARFTLNRGPHALLLDAAARLRVRAAEAAFPSVLDWHVLVLKQEPGVAGGNFQAVAEVRLQRGAKLQARAVAAEPLAALRLAFNELDTLLQEAHGHAGHRAARWLAGAGRRLRTGVFRAPPRGGLVGGYEAR